MAHLSLQLLVLWCLCHLLALSKADILSHTTTCDFESRIVQNVTCLQPTQCDTNTTNPCSDTCYVDRCYERCTYSALQDGWSGRNDLEDCLLYANISQHLSAVSPDGSHLNRTIINDPPGVSGVDRSATNTLAQCMVDFCDLSLRCANTTNTGCTLDELILDDGSVDTQAVLRCKSSLCPSIVINNDIFGVGVYIASIVQVMMGFLFVIISLVLQVSHHRKDSRCRKVSANTTTQMAEDSDSQKIKSRLTQIEKARRVISKTTATFQQAQCYYVAALTIATVYAIAPIGIRTLNELDQQALIFIAGCNIYLTSIVLMMALFTDRESVSNFSFYLSFLTWLGTLITSQFIDGSAPYYRAHRRTPGPQCSNKTVLSVCEMDMELMPAWMYSMTALVIIFCFMTFYNEQGRMIWARCSAPFSRSPGDNHLTTKSGHFALRSRARRHRKSSDNVPYTLGETKWLVTKQGIVLVAWVGSLYLWIDTLATPDFRRAIRVEWNFGQVIALTLWLPVVFEFASLIWAEFSETRRHQIRQWFWCYPRASRSALQGRPKSGSNTWYDDRSRGLLSLNTSQTYMLDPYNKSNKPRSPFGENNNLLANLSPLQTPHSLYTLSTGSNSDYITTQPSRI